MVDGVIPEERWLPVPDYEGWYEVSDRGRVRSLDRVIYDSANTRKSYRGRIMKLELAQCGGYYVAHMAKIGVRTREYVHRLVLLAFVGKPADGELCCHNDGDPTNNTLSNLRWDTPLENSADILRHGRRRGGIFKDRCTRGHLYAGDNELPPPGTRCRACQRTKHHYYKARAEGRPFDFQAYSDAIYRSLGMEELDPGWRPVVDHEGAERPDTA